MKITKKFYVASRSMIDGSRTDWPHETLDEAIEHATQLAEETEKDQAVVQIIKIVKLKKAPVVVEDVE